MSNVYDVTFQKPALEARQMFTSLEHLAQQLVASGLLRIDAHEKINFVRYPFEDSFIFISYRELHDEKLLPKTTAKIGKEAVKVLRKEIATNQVVERKLEEKIARLITQATHPAVIKLILLEGVEIFISYSHNIADLLDLQTFEEHGGNSGMQSLGYDESRIFVSTDGDPFANVKEYRENARYALARFLVIAGQEFGHYADIMRDSRGRPYSRHSANLGGYRAKKKVKEGRLSDLALCKKTLRDLNKIGLQKAAKISKSISFYKKHRRFSLKHLTTKIHNYFVTRAFRNQAQELGYSFVKIYSAEDIRTLLADMKFNLHPKAPVYENENAAIEETILCVEALARVPQQVVKWGHKTTKFLYPKLYSVYYDEVIPHVIKTTEDLSEEKFYMEYKKPRKLFLW